MTPETVSHYRILSKLGAGGMGEVYLAEDLNLGRRVALKLLPARFMQDAERVRRFAQEARTAWVQATLAGEYPARSIVRPTAVKPELSSTIVVHPEAAFDKWYQDVSGPPLDLPPVELGQRSYQMRGCTQCHTTDGSKLVGPSFKGFLAREHRLSDGTVVEPSDAYITESILDPTAKVIQGFEPVMPSFKGRLHELEVAGLVAYIKSLP